MSRILYVAIRSPQRRDAAASDLYRAPAARDQGGKEVLSNRSWRTEKEKSLNPTKGVSITECEEMTRQTVEYTKCIQTAVLVQIINGVLCLTESNFSMWSSWGWVIWLKSIL